MPMLVFKIVLCDLNAKIRRLIVDAICFAKTMHPFMQ